MRKGIYSDFTVKEKIFLTPHYIRIKFNMDAEQIGQFAGVGIGHHNKIFITEDIRRTYTTRHIDYIKKELWIDFVAHGDDGPASKWANNARCGDTLGIAMKEESRPLFPEAEKYIFAGDHTALPVIGAMLEQLPAGVAAKVIIEVAAKEDELILFSKSNMEIKWLHNAHPELGSQLANALVSEDLFAKEKFVFVAAEFETIKILKNYFREKTVLPREMYSLISYWSKGQSEDQSSAIRRDERNR